MSCIICKKEETKTENLCDGCYSIINVLYYKFTPIQMMTLFSHVLGTKIIQEMTSTMINKLTESYKYDKKDLH